MSVFGKSNRNKIALALACMSIFKGRTLAMGTIKNIAKNQQSVGARGEESAVSQPKPSANRKNICENSYVNQNSQRFSTKEKLAAAGSFLIALTGGVIGDRVVSNIFSDYSKGRKIAVRFFKNSTYIDFNCYTLKFDKKFVVSDAVNLINPGLKGEKSGRTAIEFNKCYYKFWDDYLGYVSNKYFDISLKHKFAVYFYIEVCTSIVEMTIRVYPGEDGKLAIKVFRNHNNIFSDITNEFINVYKCNGKAFIADVEKFVNGEEFMKQVLLGGKNKQQTENISKH